MAKGTTADTLHTDTRKKKKESKSCAKVPHFNSSNGLKLQRVNLKYCNIACVLPTPDLGMFELIVWAWLLAGVELRAALEGSVLVLKGKLSLHKFCSAFLDARQMAVLQMCPALFCLGLSYSLIPVHHRSKHVAISALICTVPSRSMNYEASLALAKPCPGLS